MLVTREEPVYCDVDKTLCFSHEGNIKVDYYGEERLIRPHVEHISFLKSLHSRGYHIKVHSHNGVEWAANVIRALGLEDYVHEVLNKPFKIIDDQDPKSWLPHTVYIPDVPVKYEHGIPGISYFYP